MYMFFYVSFLARNVYFDLFKSPSYSGSTLPLYVQSYSFGGTALCVFFASYNNVWYTNFMCTYCVGINDLRLKGNITY